MDQRIAKLSKHTVLCGYGRVGTAIGELLTARSVTIVVVDLDQARLDDAIEQGHCVVRGSSTEDDILREAGIEQADTLIVSLADDGAAISTVLSARHLNAGMTIIARANDPSSEAKLMRAGADRVVNPLYQGAHRMAAFAQQPDVADFLDVVVHDADVEYELEEVRIPPNSRLDGVSLADAHIRRETGALVLAVRLTDGTFESIPGPEVVLAAGTTLIALGTGAQLKALEGLLQV